MTTDKKRSVKLAMVAATASVILNLFLLSSCSGGRSSAAVGQGDTLRMEHSGLLTIVDCDGYTTVDVANPWRKGSTLHRYVLVGKDASVDINELPEGTVVRIPLRRSIAFSSVHAVLLRSMGCEESLAGIADVMYLTDSVLTERLNQKLIADVGMSANPDIESVIDLSPDALLVSPFENSGGYGKLEQMGIPLIECADYMETSPLGRAEWMRFYGILYGARERADSLFNATAQRYNSLKAKAAASKARPTVLMDKMTGNTWYVPGGHSTIGCMLADAATNYVFASDTTSGSLALAFETVIDRCADADLWLFRHSSAAPMNYATLLSEHQGYEQMRPFREKKCFACNVMTSHFFDETTFRPDLLLADIIAIAHPDISHSYTLRYFTPMR